MEGSMSHKRLVLTLVALGCALASFLPAASSLARDDGQQILTIDHYVPHTSTAPGIAGQEVQLYLRERVEAQTVTRNAPSAQDVVLFVHGAWLGGTGEFDAQYQDYSWMAYLAQSGLDTFSVDLTGYGFSTRPAPMDDPCNLDPAQHVLVVPTISSETCSPTDASQVTTIRSDWDDLDTVVDHLRALRHVDRVSLAGWSQAGSRAAGYAALHSEKVARLALLAPSYDPEHPTTPAPQNPDPGPPATLLTRAAFAANWDRQLQCADQSDPGIRASIWDEGLLADGVAWAPDQRRVPSASAWRWNRSIAARVQAPTLVVSGEFDSMTPASVPAAMRAAYADLGTPHKVFLDMACTSHFALWETRHLILFQASLDWLRDGSVNGVSEGTLRLGD
jgi:pimeloyl-ACP methyl ester carboxylesterase